MLKYLKVRNFLSFQKETEINFESSNYWNKKWNVFSIWKATLMKSVLIYWANASWKTNILKALDFIQDIALYSDKKWFLEESTPFLLDTNSKNEPSFFEIYFFIDEKEYIYNFEILKNKILSENLYEVKKWKSENIFTRKDLEIKAWKWFEKELKKWKEKVRYDSSVIAVLSQWNWKLGEKPIDYFFRNMNIIFKDISMPYSAKLMELQKNENNKQFVIEFLKSADINIDDIKITKKNLPKEFLDKFEDIQKAFWEERATRIEFWHKNYENWEIVYFDLENESDGTQKLFKILWPIIETILEWWILIIDEIETNLHLHILQNIFKLIHNNKLNKKYQFIFTTHNIELMDLSMFKKEQIWLTKKDKFGNTSFETLYDYNIRSENDVKKMYNNWAFWGIPNIKDFSILLQNFKLWEEKND